MLLVISPAKTLDYDTPPATARFTQPQHLDHAQELIGQLRQMSPQQVGELMHLSDKLAALNVARFGSWQRPFNPSNAKQALQGRYWRSFWICLVLSFVGLGGAGANSGNAARQAVSTVTDDTTAYDIVNSIPDSMLGAILVGMLIGSIAALCWALFVVYPLNVGRCRYFMESRQSLTPVSTVVSTFRRPYGNPIVVQLLTDLKIALGFLLLIVPGIYWEYCYELVPYLLAENPYMSATRAMELSKEMMEGEKWNFFILKLSFFGWLLLCVFTFGIGGFFLEPYMQATYAEFYAAMRSKALAMGMTTTDELGGFVRHDTYPNGMDF